MDNIIKAETVILADGTFPHHDVPLRCLRNASRIICCDGAARSLIDFGLEPFAIVGDCDSITPEIEERYHDRIFRIAEQETNDLTKSVKWCAENGFKDIVILGATGKREDHTIGNISLLAGYAELVSVKMLTDTGTFYPLRESSEFKCKRGQQVSIFSIDCETEITSSGLKYPLVKRKLRSWWEATLNEATDSSFELTFKGGPLIVFMNY
jgi:thiamine pyrophosphokinase